MNTTISRARHTLSPPEAEVLDVLRKNLPENFSVEINPPIMIGVNDLTYKPDLIVHRDDGKEVVVEVKSSRSLSISNLLKLDQLSKLTRSQGKGFFVIVIGPKFGGTFNTFLRDKFSNLHVSAIESPKDSAQATIEAFEDLQSMHTTLKQP